MIYLIFAGYKYSLVRNYSEPCKITVFKNISIKGFKNFFLPKLTMKEDENNTWDLWKKNVFHWSISCHSITKGMFKIISTHILIINSKAFISLEPGASGGVMVSKPD